jgi:O-antigen/teichoic acid export membrane protein
MDGSGSQTRFIGVDALFQYAGSGVQLFSGLVFYLIAVRLFNTANIGAIALFVAIVGLFNIIFTFGLNVASQHFISYNLGKGNYALVKKTIHRILIYGFTLSISGLITLQLLAGEISIVFLHSTSYTELVRILAIVLFGNILFGILNGTILGIQLFRISAMINIVIWITYYFGALVFAVFLRSIDTIVFGWLIGIFLGVFIELAVVLSSVSRYLGTGNPQPNSYIFRYSFPILLSGIVSYGAGYADRFVVSGLMSLSNLGVYNFALLIASAISFLAIPFNNILMPKFSEFFGRGEKERISSTAEVSTTLLSFFYVPSALGIAALAPIILNLLGGTQYISGAIPLRIIMFATALFISQNVMVQAVASIRRTRLLLYSTGIALVGNIIISIVLIPSYGLIGAALGYSSVFAITFFLLYYFARRESVFSVDLVGISKIWISAILMFIIVDYCSDLIGLRRLYLPAYVLFGGILYIVLARWMSIFRSENKVLIISLFPEKLNLLRKVILIVLH